MHVVIQKAVDGLLSNLAHLMVMMVPLSLALNRYQAFSWPNACILSMGPLGTSFIEISLNCLTSVIQEMIIIEMMSSAKYWLFVRASMY